MPSSSLGPGQRGGVGTPRGLQVTPMYINEISDFSGKQPAVIDIFGTGGGLMEHRGALLSSKGFAVLCLAYIDFKDLPKTVPELSMNYFEVN